MTDRYAVIGNPIGHSKSPQIHQLFAAQTYQLLEYEALLGPVGEFVTTVNAFAAAGGLGLNVTVPFKNEAFVLSRHYSDRALRANAVNTLSWWPESQCWHGDNTDGVGLVRDLSRNLGLSLAGQRILVLGAGGAVQGAVGPLLDAQPAELFIANRTAGKAKALAQYFVDSGAANGAASGSASGAVSGGGWEALKGRQFDLIINGTAASLAGELPPLPDKLLAAGGTAYDMMYGAQPTPFMLWATERGGVAHDGLGMLVEQAAESFCVWRGVLPEAAPVIAEMRQQL